LDWQLFYQQAKDNVPPELLNFAPWQLQLADHIKGFHPRRSLESGSGFAQTSFLLAETVEHVMALDLESYPLRLAQQLFSTHQRAGFFLQGDLFHLPVRDNVFDVTFNAGVFEHFSFVDRCRALNEMARVTADNGKIIVAFPNHCSYPYRYSYEYRLKRGMWPYPQEYPLVDLAQELEAMGLKWQQQRKTICRETAFYFLRRHQRWMMRLLGFFRPFEGYLTIVTICKGDQ